MRLILYSLKPDLAPGATPKPIINRAQTKKTTNGHSEWWTMEKHLPKIMVINSKWTSTTAWKINKRDKLIQAKELPPIVTNKTTPKKLQSMIPPTRNHKYIRILNEDQTRGISKLGHKSLIFKNNN